MSGNFLHILRWGIHRFQCFVYTATIVKRSSW